MSAPSQFNALGQSLWLDHITKGLLQSGGLARYIKDYAVTGLTSNPTIFAKAFKSGEYNAEINSQRQAGKGDEDLFFNLAAADLAAAARIFRPIFDRTAGVDGWVSLEVSPLLVRDSKKTAAEAQRLAKLAGEPNVYIKIPGTPEGLAAIEETIYAGIPVNVTLLFSTEQYLAAAEAYLRGLERRVEAGLSPLVQSVASLFISRWDVAVQSDKQQPALPAALHNRLGLAVAREAYVAYQALLTSPRYLRLANLGARPQRLLWASTGVKDPKASDLLYVDGLAAPLTVNTMPESTLKALGDHGKKPQAMAIDGGDYKAQLQAFSTAGIDVKALAAKLQNDGAEAFTASWHELMEGIAGAGKA